MLPQIPSGGERRHARTHFSYVTVERGGNWEAYAAGPAQWFPMHCSRRSKPCVEEMTDCDLACPFCAKGHVAIVKGYLPLYRASDGRPVVVVIDEASRHLADKLALHESVTVGRERSRGSAVWVARPLAQRPSYTTTLEARRAPADLTETLLRLWALPELVEWYRRTHVSTDRFGRGSDEPVSLPADDVADLLDAEAARGRRLSEQASRNAAFVRSTAGGIGEGAPEKNGKPRPKRE